MASKSAPTGFPVKCLRCGEEKNSMGFLGHLKFKHQVVLKTFAEAVSQGFASPPPPPPPAPPPAAQPAAPPPQPLPAAPAAPPPLAGDPLAPDGGVGGDARARARESPPLQVPAPAVPPAPPVVAPPATPPPAPQPRSDDSLAAALRTTLEPLARALREQQHQLTGFAQELSSLKAGGPQGQGQGGLAGLLQPEPQVPTTDPAVLQLASLFQEFARATRQENAETRALVAQAMGGANGHPVGPAPPAPGPLMVQNEMTDLPATINVDFPLDPQTMLSFTKVRLKMPHVYPNLPGLDWFIHYARFNQESSRLYWAQPRMNPVLNCPHCKSPIRVPEEMLPTNPFQVLPGVIEGATA